MVHIQQGSLHSKSWVEAVSSTPQECGQATVLAVVNAGFLDQGWTLEVQTRPYRHLADTE